MTLSHPEQNLIRSLTDYIEALLTQHLPPAEAARTLSDVERLSRHLRQQVEQAEVV